MCIENAIGYHENCQFMHQNICRHVEEDSLGTARMSMGSTDLRVSLESCTAMKVLGMLARDIPVSNSMFRKVADQRIILPDLASALLPQCP